MQRWKRVIGTGISMMYGVKGSFSDNPTGLRILMYHSIGAQILDEPNDIYRVSKQRFKTHLDIIKINQSDPKYAVHPFEVQASTGISFTFDDGYRDNLEVAAPLLLEHGFPFHVFVNPSFVLSGNGRYLTIQSLRELANLPGVSIGAHGYSHKKLTDCTPSDLAYELDVSKQWIESIISREVATMAYPHGAVNDAVRRATKEAGYTVAATSKFGVVTSTSDRFALERTDIWSTDTPRSFHSKLRGNWDWMSFRT